MQCAWVCGSNTAQLMAYCKIPWLPKVWTTRGSPGCCADVSFLLCNEANSSEEQPQPVGGLQTDLNCAARSHLLSSEATLRQDFHQEMKSTRPERALLSQWSALASLQMKRSLPHFSWAFQPGVSRT